MDPSEIERRLQALVNEQPVQPISRVRRPAATALGLGLAVLIGIQLGALPWRYRREIWQLQGGLVGLAVGVVIGHLMARRPD